MIRGLYTATNGMVTLNKQMEVVTNNLANAMTPGYKSDQLIEQSFADQLAMRLDSGAMPGKFQEVGRINCGVHIAEVFTNFTNGALDQTGISTDLALAGNGFFVVEAGSERRFTRNGQFSVDTEGYLATSDGHRVLGSNGPIRVGDSTFQVSASGRITHANGTDQLQLVTFDDLRALRKEGGNLYSNQGGEEESAELITVQQGSLETANLDLTKQVTDMITLSRSYEINQRMIKMLDEKLGKAVNEVGRV